MRVIGLTGGIGSGKSMVARMLSRLGADIVDADGLAREVVQPQSAVLSQIVARFGSDIVTSAGVLDRPKLAGIIFSDEKARQDLNALMHPAIARRAQEEIATRAARGAQLVVYDVPLLYEGGLDQVFSTVVVVNVPPEVQRTRLAARDKLSPDDIEARIRAQWPLSDKVHRATYVIDNGGSLGDTERQVRALWVQLLG